MPVTLHVSGLAGPVCDIEAEFSWIGLEVKEAIEEASGFSVFVSQQTLVVENNLFFDSVHLEDVCGSPTKTASLCVQMLKHKDPRILNDIATDMASLAAQALRMFRGCPLSVNFTFHATTYELGLSESKVVDGWYFEPLDSTLLLELVPWRKAFGIEPGSVSVVLCLSVDYSLVHDGLNYLAAVVMLADGRFAAMTAFVQELSIYFLNRECTLSRLLIVPTLQDLLEQSPGFMNAILQNDGPRLPLSAPIRIQLEDTQLPYDFWYSLDMFDRFEPTLGQTHSAFYTM